jgi:hypothetical protein
MKEEAIDPTLWRNVLGRGYGPSQDTLWNDDDDDYYDYGDELELSTLGSDWGFLSVVNEDFNIILGRTACNVRSNVTEYDWFFYAAGKAGIFLTTHIAGSVKLWLVCI